MDDNVPGDTVDSKNKVLGFTKRNNDNNNNDSGSEQNSMQSLQHRDWDADRFSEKDSHDC